MHSSRSLIAAAALLVLGGLAFGFVSRSNAHDRLDAELELSRMDRENRRALYAPNGGQCLAKRIEANRAETLSHDECDCDMVIEWMRPYPSNSFSDLQGGHTTTIVWVGGTRIETHTMTESGTVTVNDNVNQQSQLVSLNECDEIAIITRPGNPSGDAIVLTRCE